MSCACASEPRFQLELKHIESTSAETFSFDFHSPALDNWSEGDSSKLYLMVNGVAVGKKFSVATLPSESVIRFTTRIKQVPSDYKAALAKVQVGETVEITSPKGAFNLRREGRPVVLLSNGVGIAAIRSLVKAYEVDASGIPLLYQLNVDSRERIYGTEFDGIASKTPGFKSIYTTGRVAFAETLKSVIGSLWMQYDSRPYFYVVGSESFVADTLTFLREAGYDLEDIVLDESSCGSCGCGSKAPVQLLLA